MRRVFTNQSFENRDGSVELHRRLFHDCGLFLAGGPLLVVTLPPALHCVNGVSVCPRRAALRSGPELDIHACAAPLHVLIWMGTTRSSSTLCSVGET